MFKYIPILSLALAAFIAWPTTASAGCVGAAIGEGCIGIPTPNERHDDGDWRDRDRGHDTVIIKKPRHHHHEDDEE